MCFVLLAFLCDSSDHASKAQAHYIHTFAKDGQFSDQEFTDIGIASNKSELEASHFHSVDAPNVRKHCFDSFCCERRSPYLLAMFNSYRLSALTPS